MYWTFDPLIKKGNIYLFIDISNIAQINRDRIFYELGLISLFSDVYPDWLYPDPGPKTLINPDPDPDPGWIQVHKTTKFSKYLLIFKSPKIFLFSSHFEPFF